MINLPNWNDSEASRIGITEMMEGSRQERWSQAEFTVTLTFKCPWNRRFAAAVYIWWHAAPITGDVVGMYELDDESDQVPINVLSKWTKNNDGEIIEEKVNNVNLWSYYHKTMPIDVQISVFNEAGAKRSDPNMPHPGNFYPTPHDTYPDGVLYPNIAVQSYIQYTYAKLTVQYKAFAKPSQWNTQVTVTPSVEMRQLPSYGYFWESDGSPIEEDQAPALPEYTETIDLVFSNCTKLPAWLYAYNGHINSDVVTLSAGLEFNRTFAAGTLLYSVKSIANKMAAARDNLNGLWDVTLNFLYDPMGFNKYRRLSQLVSNAANTFKDGIVDMIGRQVKWYTESEWSSDDMPMDFSDFFDNDVA